jgi:glyoxylase-like metal-dependent hydrolase (beta-lactamase superfamily II)
MHDGLVIEQLRLGPFWNFSYLLGSRAAGEVLLIDPGPEAGVVLDRAAALGLRVVAAVATHFHADHTRGLDTVRRRSGAAALIHHADEAGLRAHYGGPLRLVADGDELLIGDISVTFRHAPGHTPGSQWIVAGDACFTGDALMVSCLGRTGPEADAAEQLWWTVREQFAGLPDATRIFPGHDYGPARWSTAGEERRRNACLGARTLAEFIACLPE